MTQTTPARPRCYGSKEVLNEQSRAENQCWDCPHENECADLQLIGQTTTAWDDFYSVWASKTIKQVQKEIKSWRSYMQKHNAAYNFHGNSMTPPDALADGDKLSILRDLLRASAATLTTGESHEVIRILR